MTPSMEISRVLGRIRQLAESLETDLAEGKTPAHGPTLQWLIAELRDLEPGLDQCVDAVRRLQFERASAREIQRGRQK